MDDNKPTQSGSEEQEDRYVPRPKWQVYLARFFLVVVILGVILYYYWIMYKY